MRIHYKLLVLALALVPAWASAGIESLGTFSIVAFDSATGEIGVAVQSKAFSVGSAVAWAEAGVGAVATQALTNESFGPKGLELLRQGLTSREVLKALLESDPGRDDRQVAVIDSRGEAVNFTGARCLSWAGGRVGKNYACQGNILASEKVIVEMANAFEKTQGELGEKLLAALVAAQNAGGDKRGMQSACLVVVRDHPDFPEYRYRYVDLRVEDHPDPINELIRLYRIHERTDLIEAHARFADYYKRMGMEDHAKREIGIVGNMLRTALAEESVDAELLNNLAWICATSDIFLDESLEAAKRAVSLKPDAPYILDTLAEVQYRIGMVDEAVSTIKRAIELDPESQYYKDQLHRFTH